MSKKYPIYFLAALLVGGFMSVAAAQTKDNAAKQGKPDAAAGEAKPGGVVVNTVKLTGTVKAVDTDKKTVTVEGSGGKTVVFDATNARNLDQVTVGDKVNLNYLEAMALFVRKTDAPPSATETQDVRLVPKGEKPGGLITRTVELTGNVEAIDAGKRSITLKGPAGNVRTFKVSPEVKNLSQIKQGDQVVLRYSEAIALSVTKP